MISDHMNYLRRIVAGWPFFPDAVTDEQITVINIENISDTCMVLDLSDGTSIRLDVERYVR